MTTTLEHLLLTTARRAALNAALTEPQQRPTPAEKHLIRLIADGHTNKQIARRLNTTPRAVDNRLRRLLSATGICCRNHLVTSARTRGWL